MSNPDFVSFGNTRQDLRPNISHKSTSLERYLIIDSTDWKTSVDAVRDEEWPTFSLMRRHPPFAAAGAVKN